ncbi:MAG: DUF2177 family protein [Pseudomonadota bacterium]
MRTLIAYGVALGTIVVLDGLWLGLVAKRLYQDALGGLMAEQVNWVAAAAFYLLYPVGLVVFVIRPELDGNGYQSALLRGAFFGLIAYATYDLTNLATLKGFPVKIALLDMLWGAVVSAAASGAAIAAGSLVQSGRS